MTMVFENTGESSRALLLFLKKLSEVTIFFLHFSGKRLLYIHKFNGRNADLKCGMRLFSSIIIAKMK